MNYLEFKKYLDCFTAFSIADIERISPRFHRRRLNEWQQKGYIKKIIKGYYMFSDVDLNENTLFEIANRIYNPSYISFEMALSHYGLIPEAAYGITSAATRRTYTFKTNIGEFTYKTVKKPLFFGYDLKEYDKNKYFKMASPEKALLDYFYIYPALKDTVAFESLRINKDAFLKHIHYKKLMIFLKKFKQKTLTQRIRTLLEFMKHA